MVLSPVLLFTFNRPQHTQQTVEALQRNELASATDLIIFSDAPRHNNDFQKVDDTRKYIHSISGFKSIRIVERSVNLGLAQSIITGVTEIISQSQKVIVLEDDLITSQNFLSYMNQALDFYAQNRQIFSITGYCPPINITSAYPADVFAFYRIHSWGWATWSDRWFSVDWDVPDFESFISDSKATKQFNRCGNDVTCMLLKQMLGEISSWAIRFNYAAYKNNALTIYPVRSKIANIGADGTGQHVAKTNKFAVQLDDGKQAIRLLEQVAVDKKIAQEFAKVYNPSIIRRLINWYKILAYKQRK